MAMRIIIVKMRGGVVLRVLMLMGGLRGEAGGEGGVRCLGLEVVGVVVGVVNSLMWL